jgi:hypothetical protein
MLMEPALRIRRILETATCWGKKHYTYAHEAEGWVKFAGLDPKDLPKNISVKMGCEVSLLRKDLIQKYTKENHSHHDNQQSNNYKEIQQTVDLAKYIKVPTLIINNEVDEVVSAEHIKEFATALKAFAPTQYNTYRYSNVPHGTYNNIVPSDFYKIIDPFLENYFELSKIKSLRQKELKDIAESKLVAKLTNYYLAVIKTMQDNFSKGKLTGDKYLGLYRISSNIYYKRFESFEYRDTEIKDFSTASTSNYLSAEDFSYLTNFDATAGEIIKQLYDLSTRFYKEGRPRDGGEKEYLVLFEKLEKTLSSTNFNQQRLMNISLALKNIETN